jgi:hypothetical protein
MCTVSEAGLLFSEANQCTGLEYGQRLRHMNRSSRTATSPALYYNLGTRVLSCDVPGSILSYERAKRLAPRDEDISYNLQLANLRASKTDPIPEFLLTGVVEEFIRSCSSSTWALLAISGL